MNRLDQLVVSRNEVVPAQWQIVTAETDLTSLQLSKSPRLLLGLAQWRAHRDDFTGSEVGLWLASDEHPAMLEKEALAVPAIAVNFPKFTDGRGYSIAALLRTRLNFSGELIAFGDVLRDQFYYLKRVGFDTLVPPAERYSEAELFRALASLEDFSQNYQQSTDQQPLWRRAPRGLR